MTDSEACQPSRWDGLYVGLSGALFSFAMGLSAVAIPLFALRSGFTAAEVGVLVAMSACAQLAVRTAMGSLMRRLADKYFVGASGTVMALSCGVLLVSDAWWAFALSQIAQGAARGIFWTGGQTHVVRTSPSSVAAIARMNLTAGLGQTCGPFLAGPIIEHGSVSAALWIAVLTGVAAMIPAALLVHLEPLRPERKPRRGGGLLAAARPAPGVGLASSAGAVAGGWRSMMNSFIPVVLAEAGHGASVIGAVVAAVNGMSILGGAVAGWIKVDRLATFLAAGIAMTGVGLAGFGGFGGFAGALAAATVALLMSGLGAGLLQTAGPALASEAVAPDQRGEAIATAGTWRAASLLGAPLVVSALLAIMSTPLAVVCLGGAMAGPVAVMRGRASPTMKETEGES